MREVAKWWEPLYRKIYQLDRELAPNSPASMFQAECGLWLAQFVQIAPKYLWAALGMSQWIETGWNEQQKSAVAIARYYLSDDRHSWRQILEAYRRYDKSIRLYDLNKSLSTITIIQPLSTFTVDRADFYQQLLSSPPTYKEYNLKVANPGQYTYKVIAPGGETYIQDVIIPTSWASLDETTWGQARSESIDLSGRTSRQVLKITRKNLREVALLLDEIEEYSKSTNLHLKPGKWEERLENITVELFDTHGKLKTSELLPLDGLVHLPGKVGAGKSTLMTLMAIWGALNEVHVTIVLGDVASSIALANDINQRLFFLLEEEHKFAFAKKKWINNIRAQGSDNPVAAPIIGRTSRGRHLQQLYRDTFEDAFHKLKSHLPHWGWRWLDSTCAINAYSISSSDFDGPIPTGQEPCLNLINTYDDELYCCPLLFGCPLHQVSRDLAKASIWFVTPAALVRTRVPKIITDKVMTFFEAVYRRSDLVIIDECDQVQASLDELMMPSVLLAGPGEGRILNELSRRLSRALQEQRSTHDTRSQRWVTAQRMADAVTDHIFNTLTSPHIREIRDWIGTGVFWNMNLFAYLVWQLIGTKPWEVTPELKMVHTQCLDRLAPFIMNPLRSQEWQGDHLLVSLGQIATLVTVNSHNLQIEERCQEWISDAVTWVRTILREHKFDDEFIELHNTLQKTDYYWESLAAKLEFAILVVLLDSRLSIVEMEWDAAPDRLHLAQFDQYNTLRWRNAGVAEALPAPPSGRLFGFQYTAQDPWDKSRDGALRRLRFPAMGRWALLQFPDLFLRSDGIWGPHTLLLSGTSWSPKSPIYHVDSNPAGVIAPRTNGDLREMIGDWHFIPVQDSREKSIAISGKQGDRRRNQVVQAAKALSKKGVLDQILDELIKRAEKSPELWGDRERILLLTGSYHEAHIVAQTIYNERPDWKEQVYFQNKSGFEIETSKWLVTGNTPNIERGNVGRFARLFPEGKILVAPAGSIGRGINILNSKGKAAFGAIVFIIRSLLPPYDPVNHARALMHWLHNVKKPITTSDSFGQEAEKLRRLANQTWRELVVDTSTWKDMSQEKRASLSATMFTQMWQAIGRGIRGDVPVIVAFIDEKWAPNTARGLGQETEESSLLIAMLSCYQGYLDGTKGCDREHILAQALYREPIEALAQMRGINYLQPENAITERKF